MPRKSHPARFGSGVSFSHYSRVPALNVGSTSQPLGSKSSINSRPQVFRPAMLTMFSFCRPQVCGLLFLPYVIKLLSRSKYGGDSGQEIGKLAPEPGTLANESICL